MAEFYFLFYKLLLYAEKSGHVTNLDNWMPASLSRFIQKFFLYAKILRTFGNVTSHYCVIRMTRRDKEKRYKCASYWLDSQEFQLDNCDSQRHLLLCRILPVALCRSTKAVLSKYLFKSLTDRFYNHIIVMN